MNDYLILATAVAFALLSAVISVRFYLHTKRSGERFRRNSLSNGYLIFVQQIVILFVIILMMYVGDVDFYKLGVSKSIEVVPAFMIGFFIYFVVLLFVEGLARLLGIREKLHDLSYETMRLIWPRDRKQKVIAFVAVCLLNPFTEEVLYRGILVNYLGQSLDNMVAAALIGFVLSIAAHMYQGSWSVPFQALFHGAAVLILLSPLGLAACIGFHFAGDLIPVVTLKQTMIAWRKRHRHGTSVGI